MFIHGCALCFTLRLLFAALCCAAAQDDAPDEWVGEALLAPDLVEDWHSGLERVAVAALLDVQQWGTSREYLVQWADGSKVRREQRKNM
jgi:hypothetical protein